MPIIGGSFTAINDRLKHVLELTGLSRSTIYAKLDPKSTQFDPRFPKQIRLGAGSVGWNMAEILVWLNLP